MAVFGVPPGLSSRASAIASFWAHFAGISNSEETVLFACFRFLIPTLENFSLASDQ
jgi:hypothetical protein